MNKESLLAQADDMDRDFWELVRERDIARLHKAFAALDDPSRLAEHDAATAFISRWLVRVAGVLEDGALLFAVKTILGSDVHPEQWRAVIDQAVAALSKREVIPSGVRDQVLSLMGDPPHA